MVGSAGSRDGRQELLRDSGRRDSGSAGSRRESGSAGRRDSSRESGSAGRRDSGSAGRRDSTRDAGSAGRREEETPEEALYWNHQIAPLLEEMASQGKSKSLLRIAMSRRYLKPFLVWIHFSIDYLAFMIWIISMLLEG